MPLYEYRCKACGHRFEKIKTYSAPDEKECPVCHAEVERLISAPSIQFKGSGFYSTDYGSRASKSASAEGGNSEGKSESKTGDGASGSEGGSSGDKGGSSDKSSPGSAPASTAPAAAPSTSTKAD